MMSSHQMATVEEYCENLLILNRGKTILKGQPAGDQSGYGRTRLAVNTSPETAAAAAALGLEPVEIRADYTEYKNQLGRVRRGFSAPPAGIGRVSDAL